MMFKMRVMIDEEVNTGEWEQLEVAASSEEEAFEEARKLWTRMNMNILTEEDYQENYAEYDEEDED